MGGKTRTINSIMFAIAFSGQVLNVCCENYLALAWDSVARLEVETVVADIVEVGIGHLVAHICIGNEIETTFN